MQNNQTVNVDLDDMREMSIPAYNRDQGPNTIKFGLKSFFKDFP